MKLRLDHVRKSFAQGDTTLNILRDLDLHVEEGEILGLVGESGSGKSTLLSVIAGFEAPDAGKILWSGQDTAPWRDTEWAHFRKRELGFVFQNYHLLPYLTARENVALPLRLLQREDADEVAGKWLERLGLGARLDHLPRQLSGGERQRVAMARALAHKPALLLADEPTGSLDVKTGAAVLELLFRVLREARQTALVVTHSPEVAARCDRVLTLQQGQLCSTSN